MSMPKLWKTNFNKFLKIFIVFLIIFTWIFSGWPQIWQNPPTPLDKYLSEPFPPKIQEAQVL